MEQGLRGVFLKSGRGLHYSDFYLSNLLNYQTYHTVTSPATPLSENDSNLRQAVPGVGSQSMIIKLNRPKSGLSCTDSTELVCQPGDLTSFFNGQVQPPTECSPVSPAHKTHRSSIQTCHIGLKLFIPKSHIWRYMLRCEIW